MPAYTMNDLYGDKIDVAVYPHAVGAVVITAHDRSADTVAEMALDLDGTKKLRKLLKKALRDIDTNGG